MLICVRQLENEDERPVCVVIVALPFCLMSKSSRLIELAFLLVSYGPLARSTQFHK